MPAALAFRLRLTVLTTPRPACGRPLVDVVAECVEAGATAIQLRDKEAPASQLFQLAVELRRALQSTDALLVVNDRLDVALAAGADGAHLGPQDVPVRMARAIAPSGFVVGYSTDDPEEASRAAADGADYLGVGAVFGTRSKPGLTAERIGLERVRAVLGAAALPGVGIGGIGPENAGAVARTGAGVAVLSAVMDALHPGEVVQAIRSEVDRAREEAAV